MIQPRLFEKPLPAAQQDNPQLEEDSWEYHYHKIVAGMDGTDEEKEAVVRKRILRYFGEFKLQSQTYFSIRSDIDYSQPGLQVLTQKLVIYGVDYMSVEKARNYFQGFLITVKRIDESHFLIQFRNDAQCLAAVNKKNKQQKTYQTPQEMFNQSNNGWIEMKPYHEFLFERKLMARFATNLDRVSGINKTTNQSHCYAYSEAKRRFMKSLKEDGEHYDRRRENYKGRHINSEHETLSKSKQRSRQKFVRQTHERMQSSGQSGHPQCHCQRVQGFSRSRSRSRSPSLDYNNARLEQEQRIRQSNFKFELYIRRRDSQSNQFKSNRAEPKSRLPSKNHMASTIISHDQQPIPNLKMVHESEELDSTAREFQHFLENLKISDSKNEYSAFEIDMDM